MSHTWRLSVYAPGLKISSPLPALSPTLFCASASPSHGLQRIPARSSKKKKEEEDDDDEDEEEDEDEEK